LNASFSSSSSVINRVWPMGAVALCYVQAFFALKVRIVDLCSKPMKPALGISLAVSD
jgi:hypothetical protein